MKSAPLISIITVCYNSVKTIEETILSVISQNYSFIEYIIIDGGSTDGTCDIIKKYESHISYWHSEPDKNMYDALNKGLKKVNGDLWIALNSDDYFVDKNVLNVVSSAYLKHSKNKFGAYFGNILKKEEEAYRKISLFPINYKLLLASEHCSFMPQPSTFLTREVISKIGLFNIDYRYASDYDYFLRVAEVYKIKHINKPITVFRDHNESITNRLAEKMNEERLRIIENYQKRTPINFSFLYKYLSWSYYLLINKRLPLKKIMNSLFMPNP
jgi:glycosyltransferase involved in cell wall biosynthesis